MNDQGDDVLLYPNPDDKPLALISSIDEYQRLYNHSVENPQQFWSEIANHFYWKSKPNNNHILSHNFDSTKGPVFVKCMSGALTNICYNVLDRQIEKGLGDRIAYHWEGNEVNIKRQITYSELRREVCKFANVLKSFGVRAGDRIAIYMSVTIEFVVSMLSCARIGAVHTVIFAGFSAETLANRMIGANCVLLITFENTKRGSKLIELKNICNSALNICQQKNHKVIACIVLNKSEQGNENDCISINNSCSESMYWNPRMYQSWDQLMSNSSDYCEPVWLDSEEPLFILYSSGSTGKPKCIVHTIGGYMMSSYLSYKYMFNASDGQIFFSTADLGWIVGHTYSVYGALANGVTVVLMEGMITYPNEERVWDIIDRLKVNVFFTAPTAIRLLMKFGEQSVKRYNRKSLKIMGFSGETINSEAWLWLWDVVGDGRCPIVDIYGQTEFGAAVMAPLPFCTAMKPGSQGFPIFGFNAAVLDSNGNELEGEATGQLVLKTAWPGIARTLDGNHQLYENTYFKEYKGYYFTGDGVKRDKNGYYWMTGRVDDTLNVSGHLLSTREVETVILRESMVSDAAAVSVPHQVKGHCIHVFVVLNNGYQFNTELEFSLKQSVRERIGSIAVPDVIRSVPGLPKTKTGKIMRKILNKICRNDWNFGDTSVMADQLVVKELYELFKNTKF